MPKILFAWFHELSSAHDFKISDKLIYVLNKFSMILISFYLGFLIFITWHHFYNHNLEYLVNLNFLFY